MKRVLSLLSTATLFAACGDSTTGPTVVPDVTMVSSANPAQYVANTLTVPLDRMQFGMDLNGDGKTDNQLGNIIGALSANNLNTQDGVDQSVCKGSVVLLMKTTSGDMAFMNDDQTGAFINIGTPFAYMDTSGDGKCEASPTDVTPKYDGTDTFTTDTTSFQGAQFAGKITNGLYSSNNPATTSHPVEIKLQLPLVSGAAPVELDIIGAHIQFRVQSGKIMSGQINGAIKNTDVMNTIIPNVGKLLDDRVTANPTGSTEKQILQIFDIGCMAHPEYKMDGMIETCEVSENSIIKNVLNPDVQMFDASGNYKPNPMNTNKDSLSLGLGFTAVKAMY